MAQNRNRRINPSSRYSRMEEPWLDDTDRAEKRENAAEPVDEGFGVRDSYSRQADYGRPDGYYDSYRPSGDLGDTRVYHSRVTEADSRYSGTTETDGRARRQERMRDREVRAESYDAWDDPEYDDRYDDRFAERDYDGRQERKNRRNSRAAAAVDADGSGKKRGFVIRLILLLLATAALAAVWRFSRMDHINLKEILMNAGILKHEGYQEFVIYGVDSREGSLTKDAHSDTIILCSMNKTSKEIRLVSVYRDTYLDNTNGEYRKATECYFFGGPERSVNMLNRNLDLALDNYITVDFNAVVRAVDLIGGVDVEVTEDELPYINGYQTENAQVTGAQITPVESAGYQHLNGIQALAYCRIRFTAGSDYRRTERQRTVLTQIFQSAKQQGPVKMAQIVDSMLPYISTSYSAAQLLSLTSGITECSLSETCGFPFDLQAANISAGDCVIPVNLARNVSQLHTFLYAETGYVPSQTVQQISSEISNATGIY